MSEMAVRPGQREFRRPCLPRADWEIRMYAVRTRERGHSLVDLAVMKGLRPSPFTGSWMRHTSLLCGEAIGRNVHFHRTGMGEQR